MTLYNELMPILIKCKIKMGIFLSLAMAVVMLVLQPVVISSESVPAADKIVGKAHGKFYIKADNVSIGSVTAAFDRTFDIEVKGLEIQSQEKITYAYESESLEELLKGFLRHLKIQNYAFEFSAETLTLINVLPGASKGNSTSFGSTANATRKQDTVTVAVIKSVIDSSQADSAGLLPDDLIVEYDGIRIHNAAQLVAEVKKKSDESSIEMIVVRDQTPLRVVVQGGFLGVRIKTERIPKADYLRGREVSP
jgi:C-terminal processing protease CtpA/Prc